MYYKLYDELTILISYLLSNISWKIISISTNIDIYTFKYIYALEIFP